MTDTQFVRGATRLRQRIRTIQAGLAVPVLVEEIGQLLLRRTLKRFDDEKDPDDRPWTPLAASTLARRRRSGGKQGKKILVQTGELRSSIRIIRGSASGAFAVNTGAGVRIGVTKPGVVPRARVHSTGSPSVPQRRFLGIGRLDVKSVDSFLRRRADKVLGAS